MGWLDMLILAAVLIPALFAARHLWKRRGEGCTGNCAGCPGCPGSRRMGKERERDADAP